jgi:hypothetical protein
MLGGSPSGVPGGYGAADGWNVAIGEGDESTVGDSVMVFEFEHRKPGLRRTSGRQ